MAQKIDLKKTRETFDKLLAQAKESVKVLDALKKEGFARARTLIPPLPSKDEAQKIANEKFVASLRKIGLATRAEIRDLEERLNSLASELKAKPSKKSKGKTETKTGEEDSEVDEG